MDKCGICGFEINPLNYTKMKLKNVSRITVLDETCKVNNSVLNLKLCQSCGEKVTAYVTELILK